MMELLVAPRLLVHPKPIPRLVFPNAERFRPIPHQDHHAIAGDAQTFTAWIPLHDCLPKLGPLQILEVPTRNGLQKTPSGPVVIPIDRARAGSLGRRTNQRRRRPRLSQPRCARRHTQHLHSTPRLPRLPLPEL